MISQISENYAILPSKNLILYEARKPENPKSLNPNPKVDFSFEPEPDLTRNLFSNWNPIKPDPKSHARPQPEPEEFWTRPITTNHMISSASENYSAKRYPYKS